MQNNTMFNNLDVNALITTGRAPSGVDAGQLTQQIVSILGPTLYTNCYTQWYAALLIDDSTVDATTARWKVLGRIIDWVQSGFVPTNLLTGSGAQQGGTLHRAAS